MRITKWQSSFWISKNSSLNLISNYQEIVYFFYLQLFFFLLANSLGHSQSSYSTLCQSSNRGSMSALWPNCQEADGFISIHRYLWHQMEEVTGKDVHVIPEVLATPPPISVHTWRGRKFEILYLKLPEDPQQGVDSSFCAMRNASEQLHWRSPLFVLQPKCEHANTEGILFHIFKTHM